MSLIVAHVSYSQQIDANRLSNWASNYINQDYSGYLQLNVLDYGLKADSSLDNASLLNVLIQNNKNKNVVLNFPNGKYLFKKPIVLWETVILKGASADSTLFYFKLNTEDHLIKITGARSFLKDTLIKGYDKNSSKIYLKAKKNNNNFRYILINENDGGRITSSWASGSIGQINSVNLRYNDTLYLDDPLRQKYTDSLFPRVEKLELITSVGLECFTVIRLDQTTGQTSNFYFNLAANCWIKGIKSLNCNFAHVEINNSLKITVENSLFKGAFDYGGGGKAYGTAVQATSSDCFIANNVFDNLRHPMLLQSACNGNVFAYNFANNSHRTEFPTDFSSDIALHGNYPYANLFEGNEVGLIWIDDSHGKNGPFNTFIRNRANKYGIYMSQAESDSQNFIGNEITGTGLGQGQYTLTGMGHFEYGNNKNGTVLPASTNDVTIKSFIYTQKPEFDNNSIFPIIGLPNFNLSKIPAFHRFSKNEMAYCDEKLFGDTTLKLNSGTTSIKKIRLAIHPNPSNGLVWINSLLEMPIIVVNQLGQIVFESNLYVGSNQLDLSNLASGMYLVKSKVGHLISEKICIFD